MIKECIKSIIFINNKSGVPIFIYGIAPSEAVIDSATISVLLARYSSDDDSSKPNFEFSIDNRHFIGSTKGPITVLAQVSECSLNREIVKTFVSNILSIFYSLYSNVIRIEQFSQDSSIYAGFETVLNLYIDYFDRSEVMQLFDEPDVTFSTTFPDVTDLVVDKVYQITYTIINDSDLFIRLIKIDQAYPTFANIVDRSQSFKICDNHKGCISFPDALLSPHSAPFMITVRFTPVRASSEGELLYPTLYFETVDFSGKIESKLYHKSGGTKLFRAKTE
ncbi:MAG: hypothetical protein ACP6IS_10085 [Candidatus Asgardarchaeia archaeon]